MKAKTGDPSRFQSYWEKDEEDIDLATAAEIASKEYIIIQQLYVLTYFY